MKLKIDNKEYSNGSNIPFEIFNKNNNFELFYHNKPDKIYTFWMFDIDAPSHKNKSLSPWVHFLSINNNNKNNGQIIYDYYPPNPPLNSKKHQYYIMVIEQDKYLNKDKFKINENRNNFDIHVIFQDNIKIVDTMSFYTERK